MDVHVTQGYLMKNQEKSVGRLQEKIHSPLKKRLKGKPVLAWVLWLQSLEWVKSILNPGGAKLETKSIIMRQ